MRERGATEAEVEEVLRYGAETNARPPAFRRSLVFTDGYYHPSNGRWYQHKEVRLIYVIEGDLTTALTVIVRYGYWELEE